MAGESRDAAIQNVVVHGGVKLHRIVPTMDELTESQTGGNSGDTGPRQNQISNLRNATEGIEQDQDDAKYEEFPDLRDTPQRIAGEQVGGHRRGEKQGERNHDRREAQPLPRD